MANNEGPSGNRTRYIAPDGTTGRKGKRKHHPPVCNGTGNFEDKNSDFICPICFEVISEAHITKCGHTFCYNCISTSLEHSNKCPKCNYLFESNDEIFPNFLLNDLITKYQRKIADKKMMQAKNANESNTVSEIQQFIENERGNLTLEDVNAMLDILAQKKQQLENDCKQAQVLLLKEFLQKVKTHKEDDLKHLQQQINVINEDLQIVEEMVDCQPSTSKILKLSTECECGESSIPSTSQGITNNDSFACENCSHEAFNSIKYGGRVNNVLSVRRKRMLAHFDDLEDSYLSGRNKEMALTDCDPQSFSAMRSTMKSGLDDFGQHLLKFTKYSSLRPLSTLSYCNDHFNTSSIVSSIEFDKDNEYFAIAGVIKKIKVFEYASAIRDVIDIHYPVNEMVCTSKISCVSWNSYHKYMLASSDYEGTVTLWDVFTGQKRKLYQEHEKRCWSVDFNRVDTRLIASGSDDSKVKIWSVCMEHSVLSLETKANVCCVKFNPDSRFHLAFGSADHCVHYYDLRNPKLPLEIFKGHKKAVSYVKFLNSTEVVSASTDSHLKLWDVNQGQCVRSFQGHVNEKNFVGLATDGDFISCGSENNSLYIYYKNLSSQVLTFRFDTIRSILEKDRKDDEGNEFVSAVCWRMGSNIVVAANSQGNIKILELV